jgi:hypothetical protein
MHQIGQIERLQVQLDKLKTETKPNQTYVPEALRVVPALQLTTKGVIGLKDGQKLLDVHHADHAQARNRKTAGISFNLSSHYQRMRDRFGPLLEAGCAGENILVATDDTLDLDALSKGLVIETSDGVKVRLTGIRVARPCLAFSTYTLNLSGKLTDESLKETLRFLDGGTRGFYCEWGGEPAVVHPGDRVFIE